MKLFSNIIITIGVISCFAASTSAEIVDRIVAVVNHKVVTQYQLQQANQTLLQRGTDTSQIKEGAVLNFLIEQELMYQEAEQADILVTDEELNNALEYIKQQNNILSDEQFKAALGQEGKTWEEFQDELRKQIQIDKIINQEVRSKVNVTDAEIEAYYQNNLDQFEQKPSSVHVRHILLNIPDNASGADVQQIQAKAEQIVQQLREGADFTTMAKEYSDHPSAQSGGELGTFETGELASPYDTAFNLNAGEVSDPIRSAKGFHILYVEEKISGGQATFEGVKPQIQAKLFEESTSRVYEEWIAKLKEKAYIEIK